MVNLETYIGLLLLIVPGFISRSIYEKFNYDTKTKTDLENTITALIYSIFIMLGNYLFISLFTHGITLMKDIKSLFNSTTFVIEYIILSLFMSYFVAWVQNHYRLNAIEWLNNKRKNENKCELAKTESLWTSLFLDGNDHLISVIKDKDKYATGIIKGIHRSNGEAKQLWLVGGQDFDFIVENFNEDIEAKGIYLDLDKNIKIIEYDLDKINSINNE